MFPYSCSVCFMDSRKKINFLYTSPLAYFGFFKNYVDLFPKVQFLMKVGPSDQMVTHDCSTGNCSILLQMSKKPFTGIPVVQVPFRWCLLPYNSDINFGTTAPLFPNSCSSWDMLVSLPKETKEFYRYPLTLHNESILILNLECLLGIYCLKLRHPFHNSSSSSIETSLSGK